MLKDLDKCKEMPDVCTSCVHQVSRRELRYISENEGVRLGRTCNFIEHWAIQESNQRNISEEWVKAEADWRRNSETCVQLRKRSEVCIQSANKTMKPAWLRYSEVNSSNRREILTTNCCCFLRFQIFHYFSLFPHVGLVALAEPFLSAPGQCDHALWTSSHTWKHIRQLARGCLAYPHKQNPKGWLSYACSQPFMRYHCVRIKGLCCVAFLLYG